MLLSRPSFSSTPVIGSQEAAGPIGAGSRREFGPDAGASSCSRGTRNSCVLMSPLPVGCISSQTSCSVLNGATKRGID